MQIFHRKGSKDAECREGMPKRQCLVSCGHQFALSRHSFRLFYYLSLRSFAPLRLCVDALNFIAIALLTLFAWTMPAPAAPLPEVVARALETNPDVRSAAALLRAADAAVWQARSNFLPTVGIQQTTGSSRDRPAGAILYSDNHTRRREAYLRWPLFNGYADYYGNRAAEYSQEAAASDLEETRESVALRLTEIYVEVLRLSEQLQLAQAYVDDLTRLMHDVKLRAEAGRIAPVDVDQARSQLIAGENELSHQRAQYAAARNAYHLVVGANPDNLQIPQLNEALADAPLDALQTRAEENSPRLKAARQRIGARDADIGTATADFLPRLSLETRKRINAAPTSTVLSDQERNEILQLSLEIPLGGKNFARRNELVEKKQAAQADADARALQLRTDLGDMHANLKETRYMAPLLKEKVLASHKVVAAYHLQFAAGKRSLLDLLSVRDELYQALTLENGNRFTRITTTARLERLLGNLRLDLNPPRQ
jgi:adhesin transport system outer membrane protein